LELYFLPAPHPISFFLGFEFFATHRPTTPPTVPHRPTHLYIWIKSRLFPIYLLTYKFKMCYFHLPWTYILNRYLPNPTYMATPTLVAIAIDPNGRQQWGNNKLKVLHGACFCSFKQNKQRNDQP
jgi:hypothetical protein